MVVSALKSAEIAEKYGMRPDQIILSAKVSGVQDLIDVYSRAGFAVRVPVAPWPYRSWNGDEGCSRLDCSFKRCATEGIGDTIRVSLTPAPNGDRTEEVLCGQQILQSLGIRSFVPQVTPARVVGAPPAYFSRRCAADSNLFARSNAILEEPLYRCRRDEAGG